MRSVDIRPQQLMFCLTPLSRNRIHDLRRSRNTQIVIFVIRNETFCMPRCEQLS